MITTAILLIFGVFFIMIHYYRYIMKEIEMLNDLFWNIDEHIKKVNRNVAIIKDELHYINRMLEYSEQTNEGINLIK